MFPGRNPASRNDAYKQLVPATYWEIIEFMLAMNPLLNYFWVPSSNSCDL